MTHADRSAAAVVGEDEQLLVLVVGGAPDLVGSLQPLMADRDGYTVGFVPVDHSPQAQVKIASGDYAAVVIFDDLTGRSVLRDLTEFNRALPVVAIINNAPKGPGRIQTRTDLRRAGAWACVFREDLCGASLEQALLTAIESYRLAVGVDASSNASPGPASGMLGEAAFVRRLTAVIAGAEAEADANYSLVWIDAKALVRSGVLDGDLLALATATLQERIVTAAGSYFAARFSAEEYVVLITHRRDVEDVETLERIRAAVGRALPAGTGEIYADIGVGIARGAVDPTPENAITRARQALVYPATGVVRTGATSISGGAEAERARQEAAATEQALRGAQDRGELSMKYQPIVDLHADGETLGFEALLRWDQPNGNTRAAADFIEVAEQSELIVSLGYWALEAAVVQLAEWNSDFELTGGLFVAVNLSGRQMKDRLLPSRVRSLLMTTGVAPDALRLEVAAETVTAAPADFANLARGLAPVGVGLWIQDFGDGACDVGLLRGLPIQGIKIARKITAQLDGTSRTSGPILHAMTAARSLGIAVVAEGVEDALQANVLRASGCKVGQGYYYDRPLGVGEVFSRLARS